MGSLELMVGLSHEYNSFGEGAEPAIKELIWAILFAKRLWTLSNSLQSSWSGLILMNNLCEEEL